MQDSVDPKANFVDALKLGMEALKLFFDNDDDGKGEKLEDIYNIRPLPYIIGTQAFMDSRDVGLGDIAEEEDGDDVPANILDAGSDSDKSDEEEEQSPQSRRVDDESDNASDEDDFAPPPTRSANPQIPKPKQPVSNTDDLYSDEEESVNDQQQAPAHDDYEEEDGNHHEVSVKDALKAQLSAKMGNQAPIKKAPPPPEEGLVKLLRK